MLIPYHRPQQSGVDLRKVKDISINWTGDNKASRSLSPI
jgi:hypothetical protein